MAQGYQQGLQGAREEGGDSGERDMIVANCVGISLLAKL